MRNNNLYVQYRSAKLHFMPDGYFCRITNGKVAIDADGAPNAYGPPQFAGDREGSGLDSLVNACYPPGAHDPLGQEDWRGILVADPSDPAKPFLKPDGYYISQTSLCDRSKGDLEPDKFIDAAHCSYIVMPQFFISHLGMRLGDLCVLAHSGVGKPVVAIVGDTCPFIEELGEMSIRCASKLGGVDVSPRDGVTFPRGQIVCRMLKHSAVELRWPLTDEFLQALLPAIADKHEFDPHDVKSYAKGAIAVDTD